MKIIIGLILGIAIGLALGWVQTAMGTPPPTKNSTEARLQALEYLIWTEHHAINYVSQRLWERYSSS
jgi:hypothetical protein